MKAFVNINVDIFVYMFMNVPHFSLGITVESFLCCISVFDVSYYAVAGGSLRHFS